MGFATTLGQLGASTVNDSGAYSAIFTAPDQEGTAIITAKVGQKSGTLSLSVSNRPAITITPLTANLALGESLQFKASQAVIWAVKGEIGSIDTKGNFKAEQEGSGQVIAILLEDPSVTATSQTITVSGAKLDATTLVSDLPLESFFGADLDVIGQLVLVDQAEGYATNLPLTLTFTSPT